MKLFRLLLTGFILVCCLGPRWAFAGAPVWVEMGPTSSYTDTQDTVSVSSVTPTTIAASTRYRTITLQELSSGTSVHYRIDGSTISVPTKGLSFTASTGVTIETNAVVYLQLSPGVSALTLRELIRQK